MAGYKSTAKRKAAIKRWQAAGAASRARRIAKAALKGYANLGYRKFLMRPGKLNKNSTPTKRAKLEAAMNTLWHHKGAGKL